MAVIDELIVRKGTTRYPIDSYDNKMIDEIVYEGQSFHFAKQKDLTGTSEIVADNGVAEPIISLGVSGNTTQKTYEGYQLIPLKDGSFSVTDSDGNVLSWEIKDGIVTVNGKWNEFRVISLDYRNYNQIYYEAGTYTYTTAYYQGEGFPSGGLSCDWKFNFFDETGTQTSTTGWTNTNTRPVQTQTFAHRFRIQHIQVYIQGNTEYTNLRYAPALFKGTVTSTDIPPYEPYVGGIPSPNPSYQQEIENANDSAMSITLHGYNLLNKEEFGMGVLRNETEYKGYGGLALSVTQINTMLKPNTTYAMSFEVEGVEGMPDGATIHSGQGFIFTPKLSGAPYIHSTRSNKIANKGEIYTHTVTFTTVSNFYEAEYTLYTYTGRYTRTDGTMDNATCIFRNVQIVEETEEKPFQPYFREEIAIPTSVEVEGATVPLRFAKQGDKADKLLVNRLSGKVTYEQWVKTEPLPIESATWGVTTTANQVNTLRVSTYLYNSYSGIRMNEGLLINKFKEIFDLTLDEQSFYLATGSLLGWIGIRVNRDLLETQDSAGVKKWLQTQQDEGDPVLVNYALVTPIEYDLTNTDLGQSLLALATGKGTNYLEITSNLEPSQTEFSYWQQIIPNE